jgi:hypothetical protein
MAQTKLKFLEQENQRLSQEKQNLADTLKINKQMLQGVLTDSKLDEQDLINQLQDESLLLMDQLDGVIEERSDLIAKTLILEQINLDLSAKLI